MKTYRSTIYVRAIRFDVEDPGVFDTLEELGLLVNRRKQIAMIEGVKPEKVRPGDYIVQYEPHLHWVKMGAAKFEDLYESTEELVGV